MLLYPLKYFFRKMSQQRQQQQVGEAATTTLIIPLTSHHTDGGKNRKTQLQIAKVQLFFCKCRTGNKKWDDQGNAQLFSPKYVYIFSFRFPSVQDSSVS